MILGNTRTGGFVRPTAANPNFHPRMPHTGFLSQINPFSMVSRRMGADKAMYRPPYPAVMGPQTLPDVPMPPAPVVPKAGGMAGFGGAGFGSTGGTMHPHFHVPSPYRTMRGGFIPGVMPSGANIRYATKHTGALIHRSMPYQTAPLPELAPVAVAVAPGAPTAVPALHGSPTWGPGLQRRGGSAPGWGPGLRRRSWFSRVISPETVAEGGGGGCEKIGPRADGLYVTICNGRVTSYSDAAGNVQQYVTA